MRSGVSCCAVVASPGPQPAHGPPSCSSPGHRPSLYLIWPVRLHPAISVRNCALVVLNKVAYYKDVRLDVPALEGGLALGHPFVVRIAWHCLAISGDETTETNARMLVQQRQDGFKDLAFHFLKIHISQCKKDVNGQASRLQNGRNTITFAPMKKWIHN